MVHGVSGMTQALSDVLDKLKALQALDLRAQECETELKAGPAAVTDQSGTVAALASQVKALEDRARLLRAQIKLRENELKGHEQKVAKLKEQAGAVKNNKEFMAFRAEIANAQAEADRLQNEVLKILDVVQQADTKVAELNAQKSAAQKKLDDARAKVDGSLSHVKKELAALLAARPSKTAGIPAETLELYERARKSRGNALAAVEGEYCSGCGERQTKNDLYAVQNSTRVVTCKACNRILIAG
jgi:uncharacterized protein